MSRLTMSTPFSSGFELAPFVTSSGLLPRSWNAIISPATNSNIGVGLSWKVHKDSDNGFTIIAFEVTSSSPFSNNIEPDLVTSSAFRDMNFHHFEFLCTRQSPFFCLNKDSMNLFYENHQKLDQLKSQITKSTKLIITGHALGGSIAILFTLTLLGSNLSRKNRLLCITFGSPLIGDKNLQQAISLSSVWNSCFLQVVSHKDPLPTLFIKNHTAFAAGLSHYTSDYMPFGIFLFCSDASSTCFESPDSILELLKAMASIQDQNQGIQPSDYGNIVENLYSKAICKKLTVHDENMTGDSSLQACISLQLGAVGLTPHMQQQQQNGNLVTTMEKQEKVFNFRKRSLFNRAKKLSVVEIDMAQLEWYKKDSKNRNIGYYDCFKNMFLPIDHDAFVYYKNLTNYWKNMVEEAEMMPRKEVAAFRSRWVPAGTIYRRMVEPLDIANYYRDGGQNYITMGRSRHYKLLEEWLREETGSTSGSNSTRTKDVESILTFDSCFWAHVEEALLSWKVVNDFVCSDTQKEEARRKLIEFDEYVYKLLKNYEVSSEIFLKGSSYMFWWHKYKKIVGDAYSSKLARFMSNAANYERYARGAYYFG